MAKITEHSRIEETTTLGRETNFQGTLRFTESLRILGRFSGEIISPGRLVVEEGAEVKATILVGSVVVGGVIRGNITAKDKLEMLATGKVIGNIKTAKLKIADGVVFEGKCEMIKDPESIDIFSESADILKRNIEQANARPDDQSAVAGNSA
ncbi:MAG: polymer-forming cytoskeletal protein [Spirochaetales bacterium]|nr:polymer-forming cytoskeletal protein [Spirochaetales bacterium]